MATERQYLDHMRGMAAGREARWRELSRWVCPWRGIFDGDSLLEPREEIIRFTHAAASAVSRGASGMTSGMTPRNIAWFKPEFSDSGMMEASGAREWLDNLDRLMRDCLANGGFYQAIQNFNTDLLWAGCACLYSEKSVHSVLRFECVQPGSFYVALDNEGRLDAVARALVMNPAAMELQFGRDALSEAARRKLESAPWEPCRVWQFVRRVSGGRMPYESTYWEDGRPEGFLRKSGFMEMPFFFTVWHEGACVYGSGPGDDCLADARQMDQLERRKLEGLSKLISPPVLAPTNLKNSVDLAPDGITFGPEGSLIRPVLDLSPYAQAMRPIMEEIATVARRLESGLMASIFASMPLEQRPRDMSATEFLERKREALQQLGPVMSAYEPNVLTPLLHRVAASLDREQLLPPAPDALKNYPLIMKMEFISPMANALRQTGVDTTRALMADVAQIAQAANNPEILDKLDLDQIIDEIATGLGVPGSIVRSDEDVAAIRQARAAQQQAAAQAAAIQQAAQQAPGPDKPEPDQLADLMQSFGLHE